jgi:streptogramin lyase
VFRSYVARAASLLVAAAILSTAWCGAAWAVQITEFSTGIAPDSGPWGITAGPDGNLWFTERHPQSGRIGRITPAGKVTEFPAGPAPTVSITAGPDGNVWFASMTAVGRITPTGTVKTYPIGEYQPFDGGGVNGMAVGPDGNLWFTGQFDLKPGIGRITPSGAFTHFDVPAVTGFPHTYTGGIAAGPDGNLWFTEVKPARIGRITPAGQVTMVTTGLNVDVVPLNITAGADGNLWLTESSNQPRIQRITTAGKITEFSAGLTSAAVGITAGPDGNMWFTEGARIGRITPSGTITEYASGIGVNSGPMNIANGRDHNLWFTEFDAARVARLTPTTARISPARAFKLPSAHRCVSRRHFKIRIRKLPGVTWASAKVYVNGKRVKTVKRARITAPVDLRGLPEGRYTVKIVAVTTDGRTVRGKRRYRTCAGAAHHHHPPKL